MKMTTAQVVETSVTVNNNSPIQEYVHPDDQTQPNKRQKKKPFLPRAKCKIGSVVRFLKRMHVLLRHSSIPAKTDAIASGRLAKGKVL